MQIEETLNKLNAKFGSDTVKIFGDTDSDIDERKEVISTGILTLDLATGIGGYPAGRIVEIYGEEGAGKSLLGFRGICAVQQIGKYAALIDTEKKVSKQFMHLVGVDTNKLVYSSENNAERVFETIESLCSSDDIRLIVVDSATALLTKKMLDGGYSDPNVAEMAKFMSQGIKKLNGAIAGSSTTVIFVNQERMRPMIMFGNPADSTAGKALRFHSTIRIYVKSSSKILATTNQISGKSKDSPVGHTVRCTLVKNQVGPPYKEATFDIYYTTGVDYAKDTLLCGLYIGRIKRNNSWYYIGDEKFNGEAKVLGYIKTHPELYEQIRFEMVKSMGTTLYKDYTLEETKSAESDTDTDE